jgi:hypothetical protein
MTIVNDSSDTYEKLITTTILQDGVLKPYYNYSFPKQGSLVIENIPLGIPVLIHSMNNFYNSVEVVNANFEELLYNGTLGGIESSSSVISCIKDPNS